MGESEGGSEEDCELITSPKIVKLSFGKRTFVPTMEAPK
jgi:hypothetical protein